MSHKHWHHYSNGSQDKPWYERQIRKEIERNLAEDRIRAQEAVRQERETPCG